jgi:hypothetical protein
MRTSRWLFVDTLSELLLPLPRRPGAATQRRQSAMQPSSERLASLRCVGLSEWTSTNWESML